MLGALTTGLGCCESESIHDEQDYLVFCGNEKFYAHVGIDAVPVESFFDVPVTLGDLGLDWSGLIGHAISVGGAVFANMQQAAVPNTQGLPEADQVALAVYANIDALIPMIQSGAVPPADAMAAARRFQVVWLSYRGQTRDGRHAYLDGISDHVRIKVELVDKAAADYIALHSVASAIVPAAVGGVGAVTASTATGSGFKVTPNMLIYGGGGLVLLLLYFMFR